MMKAGSKYRHIFGKEAKVDQCYDGLRILNSAWDADGVCCSDDFLAVPMQGGGGPVCVLKYDQTGKRSDSHTVAGHKGQVLDMSFSPFNSDLLLTGSDDTTCKLWRIPADGLTENMHADQALATLSGHAKKVGIVKFNPVAENIVATSSIDKTVKIWDVETGQECFSVDGFADYPTSMDWSHDGSVMAAVTKSKELHTIDPRESAIMSSASSHPGAKSQRCLWLGDSNLIFTFGFSKSSERELAVWDPKNLSTPVWKDSPDVASGVLMPLFDPDLKVLYLGGKGDGNIRYFELKGGGELFYLNQFGASNSQAGLCMKPKRCCDTHKMEVATLFKMEKTTVVPISFVLPRKGDSFHEDVYPNSAAPTPAIASDEWQGGAIANPVLMSLDPSGGGSVAAPTVVKKKASGMAGKVHDLEAEVASLKEQLAAKDAEIAALKAGGAAAPAPVPAPAPTPVPEPADDDDDEPAE